MSEKKIGKVTLVGAGPGDPDLITVKGLDAISRAEVVIYDYLANPVLLAAANNAEIIYVGKTGASHTMEQDDINALLAQKALEGYDVVRLKGGDPYMFGRGSEEMSYCREKGVDVVVIPGIPAAIGAGSYAGIPLTDRRHTSSVTFVTGHEDPTKETSSIEWEHLAKGKSTLVFYMGVKNLPSIAQQLMNNGMAPETPVGLVEWATTTRQRTVQATLGTAAKVAEEKKVKAPALIIVGGVTTFPETLGWFEKLPLFGQTVVVTRTRAQASGLVRSLRDLGATVVEAPTIAIAPPDSWAELDEAVANISDYNWIVFTSTNGVDAFFDRLAAAGKDARALTGAKIAAIGPETQRRLAGAGILADFRPKEYVGEAVAQGIIDMEDVRGKNILLPRSEIAREDLPRILKEAGADVHDVTSYRTIPPPADNSPLRDVISSGKAGLVTFTSSSTARHFVEMLGADFVAEHKSRFAAASIGPVTSATLRELDIEPALEATEYTIPGLVSAILAHAAKRG